MTQSQVLSLTTSRISSLDVLRGIVMVIMALDHTREYLLLNGFYTDPTNLTTTTPILFFTRWITHLCAPTFVFLAGTSAYLYGLKKTKKQLSLFLLTRGLWLIILEITIVNFELWFDITFSTIVLQVIWAIGISMIILSGLVFLPVIWILALAILIVVGHNLLDPISFPSGTPASFLWSLLHQLSFTPLTPHFNFGILYPFLSWLGILLIGYCFGMLYRPQVLSATRKKILLQLGIGAIVSFMLLRFLNVYGDPTPWKIQKDTVFTILSFFNVTKYPPSLLYTLITLAPGILLLSVLEGKEFRWTYFFKVYGKVPLFYYVIHFYLIHSLSVVCLLVQGISWQEINFQKNMAGIPPNVGFSLSIIYLFWIGVVLVLYPVCRCYGQFKSRQTTVLWSYL
ncbi:heparan-alpha-glucosaminide N-acetyltransferase domain-containing protein [Cytophagaceae bacterium DM2B3-1]|uniref:Heparan-alpha-glucosaminide N-acetyltransferase domain-containing protein n=1 Tax=Xanthocytophaga flava TaxID=3048013 RepID=A0ABT7CFJ2_9BACT|nr:heparan-alpha-glucosaminide N-acetyltransferase domain-containing protein [Xanthocytophaga flavus]MDJ1492428.1 heparan-alpha-glucosaminide N-acetyltransferase domain-containing protein [Xanthocytophaga flavus]